MPPTGPTGDWSEKIVRLADLRAIAGAGAGQLGLIAPDLPDDAAVLRGHFSLLELREGLHLHASDTHELHDLETRSVQPPGLTFSVILKGSIQVSLGGRDVVLGATAEQRRGSPDAVAMSRARSDILVRRARRGAHVRKVNISISPEWLADGGLDSSPNYAEILRFARTHLACERWQPSPRVVSLAEQILRPPAMAPLLHKLYLESRAIEIVAEALGAIGASRAPADRRALHPRDYRRACQVCEFIRSNLPQRLTLGQLAREFGMSVNTLQRVFHAAHGTTVFDYLRSCRLDRARDSLERDGISVSEVAYLSGYSSAANFASAFKRRFGICPRDVRSRV